MFGRSLRVVIAVVVAVPMAALLASGNLVAGQSASPAASPGAVACDVEPRTEEELAQLAATAATPAADPGGGQTGDAVWDGGVVADEETAAEIESALFVIDVCAASGDAARLLALYTDTYIVREVLATEPVPILPGTPDTTASTGTPEAAGTVTTVLQVRMLEDGRVAALVERDGRTEIVVFVEADGRWFVDGVEIMAGEGGMPAAGVSDELASLPPVRAAVADAAAVAAVDESEVSVTGVEATVWSDSSLGCPKPDEFYAQVQTPGYVVTLDVAGTEVTYHTDEGEAAVPCAAGGS